MCNALQVDHKISLKGNINQASQQHELMTFVCKIIPFGIEKQLNKQESIDQVRRQCCY